MGEVASTGDYKNEKRARVRVHEEVRVLEVRGINERLEKRSKAFADCDAFGRSARGQGHVRR
jgi:hypothetical protein